MYKIWHFWLAHDSIANLFTVRFGQTYYRHSFKTANFTQKLANSKHTTVKHYHTMRMQLSIYVRVPFHSFFSVSWWILQLYACQWKSFSFFRRSSSETKIFLILVYNHSAWFLFSADLRYSYERKQISYFQYVNFNYSSI